MYCTEHAVCVSSEETEKVPTELSALSRNPAKSFPSPVADTVTTTQASAISGSGTNLKVRGGTGPAQKWGHKKYN